MADYSDRPSLSFSSLVGDPYRLPAQATDVARWRFDRDIQSIISPYARPGETINAWPDEVGSVAGLGLSYLLGSPPSPSSTSVPQGYLDLASNRRMGLITGGSSVICRVAPGATAGSPVALPSELRTVPQTIRALFSIPSRRNAVFASQLSDAGSASSSPTNSHPIWILGGDQSAGAEASNQWSYLYINTNAQRSALVHLHHYGAVKTVQAQYWKLGLGTGTYYVALARDDIGGGLCRYRLHINGVNLTSRGVSISNESLTTATFSVPTGGTAGDYGSLILGNRSPANWYSTAAAIQWHDFAVANTSISDEDLLADFEASRLAA